MLTSVFAFLTSSTARTIFRQLSNAALDYKNAETEQKRIEAEERINFLQAKKDLLIASTQDELHNIAKFLLTLPAIIYWWKLIIWDTVLGLGVTQYPGDHVVWYVTLVPPAYFISLMRR